MDLCTFIHVLYSVCVCVIYFTQTYSHLLVTSGLLLLHQTNQRDHFWLWEKNQTNTITDKQQIEDSNVNIPNYVLL